jgi:hypothetical protein
MFLKASIVDNGDNSKNNIHIKRTGKKKDIS